MPFTLEELQILARAAEIIRRVQDIEAGSLHTVTREWIHANRTKRGGWKAKQLAAIGLKWPPINGWQARSEGKQITQEARQTFESYGRGPAITGPTEPVPQTSCNCDVPPWEDCPHTSAP